MTELQSLLAMLERRLIDDESLEVEFKAARNSLPKDVWPTASAFANTQGGWIVLGVAESGGKPVSTGVDNPSALLKTFYDAIRNP